MNKVALGIVIAIGIMISALAFIVFTDPLTQACWHTEPFSIEEQKCELNYLLEQETNKWNLSFPDQKSKAYTLQHIT